MEKFGSGTWQPSQNRGTPRKGGEPKLWPVWPCVRFWEPSRENDTSEAPNKPRWSRVGPMCSTVVKKPAAGNYQRLGKPMRENIYTKS